MRTSAPAYDDRRDGFGYSALFDRHLQDFYAAPHRRRQLRDARVITKGGIVVDDTTFKRREVQGERRQREEQKRREVLQRDVAALKESLRTEKRAAREQKRLAREAKARVARTKAERDPTPELQVEMHRTRGSSANAQPGSAQPPVGEVQASRREEPVRRDRGNGTATGANGRHVVLSSSITSLPMQTPIRTRQRPATAAGRPTRGRMPSFDRLASERSTLQSPLSSYSAAESHAGPSVACDRSVRARPSSASQATT